MESNEKKKDLISEITNLFPILTLVGLSYGVIYQSVYYTFFNINILKYTDISELLLDTVTHLIIIFILGVIFHGFIWIRQEKKEAVFRSKLDSVGSTDQINLSRAKNQSRLKKLLKILLIIFFLHYFFFTGFMIYLYCIGELFNGALGLFLVYTFVVCIIYFMHFFLSVDKNIFSRNVSLLLIYFILIILSALFKGTLDIYFVRNYSTVGTYIIREKDTIYSTKTYYFIGNTKNYIFFHRPSTNHTDIIDGKTVRILSTN